MLNISYPAGLEINHKTLNAFDIPTYKMTPHFEEAFQFISKALEKGNLLVHCAAGISRVTSSPFSLQHVYVSTSCGMTK